MNDKKNQGLILYPAKNLKVVVDNLNKKVFDKKIPAKKTLKDTLTESRKKKVSSTFTITNHSENDAELTEFDRAVLSVCIAEQAKGNQYTTANIIFHQLGGGRNLTDKMRNEILNSLEKLSKIRVEIDMGESAEKKMYSLKDTKASKDGEVVFRGYLLPTESITATVNGQTTDAIKFLSKGIIYGIANLKNQIETCPLNLLNAPIRATPRNIAVNHYLLRRTLEIKGSKNGKLRSVILFQDLYEKCGISSDNKRAKQQMRETATAILNFFVEQGVIKSFRFEKKDGEFYSIILTTL